VTVVHSVAASGGTTYGLTQPAVVLLTVGDHESGEPREFSVAKVEYLGTYAAIAVLGAGPENLEWFADVLAAPRVVVRDGTWTRTMTAREVVGEERQLWWARARTAGAVHDDAYATLQIRVFCLEAPELVVLEELPRPVRLMVVRDPDPTPAPRHAAPEVLPVPASTPPPTDEEPLGGWPTSEQILPPIPILPPQPGRLRQSRDLLARHKRRPKREH
jgi:deazaflavin-dependent oxidoreductase (nitroreductase family)